MKTYRISRKSRRPIFLTLLLALLCVGGMELAFCHHFSPVLFRQITDPVVKPVCAAVDRAQEQLALWRFRRLCRSTAADIVELSAGYHHPRPVLLPEPAQIVLPVEEAPPPAEPLLTEFVQSGGRTVLTGGAVPCVYYNQGDAQWRDKLYGTDPIGTYGCGPTAMSMVVSSLTEKSMDPAQMAEWAYKQGYWCAGSGSYHSIIKGTAEAYGLVCTEEADCDARSLYAHLSGGGMAVVLVGPGHFTKNGHFIVLHGATLTGKVLVADPNSRKNSLALWDPQLILDEAAGEGVRVWLISQKLEL